jgi:hypothetical protein
MIGLIVTDKMREAGEQIASDCMDAACRKAFGTLGGGKEFDVSDFHTNSDLILKYVDDEITSVEAIYLAMERVK